VPARNQALVPGELPGHGFIAWAGLREAQDERRQDRAVLGRPVDVVLIDPAQDLNGFVDPEVVCQGNDVEVVTHLIALHHEVGLDPQRICRRPASMPSSDPRIVIGGLDARTGVAQPSLASIASRTSAYRSARPVSTWA
jgi:hypothetical protein